MRNLFPILILAACAAPAPDVAALGSSTPWTLHTIVQGASYPSKLAGADGTNEADVNGDGLLDVTTPYEEGNSVTISLHPTIASDPWPTVDLHPYSNMNVEDSIFADVDGDGHVDVISSCECGKIFISFAPTNPANILTASAWTTISIASAVSSTHEHWMQGAFADVDGDGIADIIDGARVGSPNASIAWFRNPGGAAARSPTAWVRTNISVAGWTMSVIPLDVDGDGDIDIVASDRTYYVNPDGSHNFSLRGTRWIENLGGGATWTNHVFSTEPGLGDQHFVAIADVDGDGTLDVVDGTSTVAYPPTGNHLFVEHDYAGTVTRETIPAPANFAAYQGVAVGDIDGDGINDIAVSGTLSNNVIPGGHPESAVVWLKGPTWTRQEVSGNIGTKFDSVQLVDVDGDGDLDIVTSEQVENLGVIWYENPTI